MYSKSIGKNNLMALHKPSLRLCQRRYHNSQCFLLHCFKPEANNHCTNREARHTVLQFLLLCFSSPHWEISHTAFLLGKFTVQKDRSKARHGKEDARCISCLEPGWISLARPPLHGLCNNQNKTRCQCSKFPRLRLPRG